MEIAAVIRTEASEAIDTIHQAIDEGNATEEDILDEWNAVFESEDQHYETFDELLEWLRTIGI
jgi:hypothetical protein